MRVRLTGASDHVRRAARADDVGWTLERARRDRALRAAERRVPRRATTAGRPRPPRPRRTTGSASRASPRDTRSARSPRAPASSTSSSAPCRCSFRWPSSRWCLDSRRVLAWGRLAGEGPGIFGPNHGTAADIAGQGVADPSSMLLAAALMLGEGLGERGARRRSSSAVSYVRGNGVARAVGTVSMTQRADRRRSRTATALALATPSSSRRPSDANERRRRSAALARGRGRRHDLRHPRRRDPADLRRAGARHLDQARARPPRAGRRPHGRGLRARVGPRRSRARDLRPGRHEPRHRRSRTPGWTRPRSSASRARCART